MFVKYIQRGFPLTTFWFDAKKPLGSIFRLFVFDASPMRQKFGNSGCWNFAALEGSPHENGYNSETKSRKMLPKVPKRPERRGLGPYSKKTKFLGQIFFWPFLAFFGHFLAVFGLGRGFFAPNRKVQKPNIVCIYPINNSPVVKIENFEIRTLSPPP